MTSYWTTGTKAGKEQEVENMSRVGDVAVEDETWVEQTGKGRGETSHICMQNVRDMGVDYHHPRGGRTPGEVVLRIVVYAVSSLLAS